MKPVLIHTILPVILAARLTAGTAPEPIDTCSYPAAGHDCDWQVTLGMYGWGAGLDGDIGFAGFSVPVDLSFSDVLDSLDMTAMGAVEWQSGNWSFQFEGLYLKNSVGGLTAANPILPRPVAASIEAETTRLETIAAYRMFESDRTTMEVFAGAVFYDIENTLALSGPRAVRKVEAGDDWLDPLVGVRINHQLGGRWSTQIRGEVGGFGVNADLMWQAAALLGYDFGDSSTAFVGWRHAAVDYENGGFLYDVANSGPILGVAIRF